MIISSVYIDLKRLLMIYMPVCDSMSFRVRANLGGHVLWEISTSVSLMRRVVAEAYEGGWDVSWVDECLARVGAILGEVGEQLGVLCEEGVLPLAAFLEMKDLFNQLEAGIAEWERFREPLLV